MAKPGFLPRWATGGGAVVVDPPSGKKDQGYVSAEVPTEGHMNWLFNTNYLWATYLDNLEAEPHSWTAANEFTDLVDFQDGVTIASNDPVTATITNGQAAGRAIQATASGAGGAAVNATAEGGSGTGVKGTAEAANGKGVHGLAQSDDGVGVYGVAEGDSGVAGDFLATGNAARALRAAIAAPVVNADGNTVAELTGGPTKTSSPGGYEGGTTLIRGGQASSDGDTGGAALTLEGGTTGAGVTQAKGGRAINAVGAASKGNYAGGDAASFIGGDAEATTTYQGGAGANFVGGIGDAGGVGAKFAPGESLDGSTNSPAIFTAGKARLTNSGLAPEAVDGYLEFTDTPPAGNASTPFPRVTGTTAIKAQVLLKWGDGGPVIPPGSAQHNVSGVSIQDYTGTFGAGHKAIRVTFATGLSGDPQPTVTAFVKAATPEYAEAKIVAVGVNYVDVQMFTVGAGPGYAISPRAADDADLVKRYASLVIGGAL